MDKTAGSDTNPFSQWPPFSIMETWWLDSTVEMSLMCGGVRVSFVISSPVDNSHLYLKLSHVLKHKEEPESLNEFNDWVLTPLKPLLWQLYSQRDAEQCLLSAYLRPLALAFRLVDSGKQSLLAVPYEGDYRDILQPVFHGISPLDLTTALTGFRGLEGFTHLGVPLFKDSEITIERDKESEFYNVPVAVLSSVSNCKMAFKPATSLDSFQDEVCTYLHLHHRQPDPSVHIPALVGLVQCTATHDIVGILTRWIPDARVLEDLCYESVLSFSPALRAKWDDQITQAVHALHRAGLVWGDVAPKNVLIDDCMDAWVVDFGGGYSSLWTEPEWMDNYQCTAEGDCKGLERLRGYLRGEYP